MDATSISTFCETAWPAFVTSPLEQIISSLPFDGDDEEIITAASQSETSSDDTFSTSTTAPPTSMSPSTDSVLETNTPSSDENTRTGLSKEVQAGIGVGVSLGVLLLLGIGLFFGWRSRRTHGANRNAEPMSMSAQGVTDPDGASYGAKNFESMDGRLELESVNPPTHHEMYVPVEPKVELESDSTRHL
jgi:hypothetical protein